MSFRCDAMTLTSSLAVSVAASVFVPNNSRNATIFSLRTSNCSVLMKSGLANNELTKNVSSSTRVRLANSMSSMMPNPFVL